MSEDNVQAVQASVDGILSRGGKLVALLSKLGLHGLDGIRASGHLVTVYETLAKAKGSDAVTVNEFQAALAADASTHPFLDLIVQYLPFILSILSSLFHFPVPVVPAT